MRSTLSRWFAKTITRPLSSERRRSIRVSSLSRVGDGTLTICILRRGEQSELKSISSEVCVTGRKGGSSSSRVAEVRIMRLRDVSFLHTRFISSANPSSRALSYSSSTSVRTPERSTRPRVMWSSRRPGVAMMMSGVTDSEFFSSCMECPP